MFKCHDTLPDLPSAFLHKHTSRNADKISENYISIRKEKKVREGTAPQLQTGRAA